MIAERFAKVRDGLKYAECDQTPAADAAWQLAILEEQFTKLVEVLREIANASEAGANTKMRGTARAALAEIEESVSETLGLRNIDPDAYDNYEIGEDE